MHSFAHSMTIVLRLRNFCKSIIRSVKTVTPPNTYEAYAQGLEQLLEPFTLFLSQKEYQMKEEPESFLFTVTVLNLHHEMEKYFKFIEYLYKIHVATTLDYTSVPGKDTAFFFKHYLYIRNV